MNEKHRLYTEQAISLHNNSSSSSNCSESKLVAYNSITIYNNKKQGLAV